MSPHVNLMLMLEIRGTGVHRLTCAGQTVLDASRSFPPLGLVIPSPPGCQCCALPPAYLLHVFNLRVNIASSVVVP